MKGRTFLHYLFSVLLCLVAFESLLASASAWLIFKELAKGIAVNIITDVISEEFLSDNKKKTIKQNVDNLEKRLNELKNNGDYPSNAELEKMERLVAGLNDLIYKVDILEKRVDRLDTEIGIIKNLLMDRFGVKSDFNQASIRGKIRRNAINITFRFQPREDINEIDLKEMLYKNDFFDLAENPNSRGFPNDFVQISSGLIIFDRSSGLMWQQSGSHDRSLSYEEAQEYISELNRKKYAGYDDWRLPTLEEAMSLVEPVKKPKKIESSIWDRLTGDEKLQKTFYAIDPLFDERIDEIWTTDIKSWVTRKKYNYKLGTYETVVEPYRWGVEFHIKYNSRSNATTGISSGCVLAVRSDESRMMVMKSKSAQKTNSSQMPSNRRSQTKDGRNNEANSTKATKSATQAKPVYTLRLPEPSGRNWRDTYRRLHSSSEKYQFSINYGKNIQESIPSNGYLISLRFTRPIKNNFRGGISANYFKIDRINNLSFVGSFLYLIPGNKIRPYIEGGAGYVGRNDDSINDFFYEFDAGIQLRLASFLNIDVRTVYWKAFKKQFSSYYLAAGFSFDLWEVE